MTGGPAGPAGQAAGHAGRPAGHPAGGPPAASRQLLSGLAEARWVLADFGGLSGLFGVRFSIRKKWELKYNIP